MGKIQRAFGVPVAVLPVIHLQSPMQAIEEAERARDCGAQGAFLIAHEGSPQWRKALTAYAVCEATTALAPFWLGVNLLGVSPTSVYWWLGSEYLHPRGVWSNASGVSDREVAAVPRLAVARTAKGDVGELFFGGVAFKHQPQPTDLAAACWAMVSAGVDVLTTSGPATGAPCDPEKVRAIRAAVGNEHGVAVASGVTAENAPALVAAGADALLVATGIARAGDFHRLDESKLRALVEAVREASR